MNDKKLTGLEVLKSAIESFERVTIILGTGWLLRQHMKDMHKTKQVEQVEQGKQVKQSEQDEQDKQGEQNEENEPSEVVRVTKVIALTLNQILFYLSFGWIVHQNFNDPLMEKFVTPIAVTLTAISAYLYHLKIDRK